MGGQTKTKKLSTYGRLTKITTMRRMRQQISLSWEGISRNFRCGRSLKHLALGSMSRSHLKPCHPLELSHCLVLLKCENCSWKTNFPNAPLVYYPSKDCEDE